jgi:hypothetical protein
MNDYVALVECHVTVKPKNPEKTPNQCHFVHHKSHRVPWTKQYI